MRYFILVSLVILFLIFGIVSIVRKPSRTPVTNVPKSLKASDFVNTPNSSVVWTMQGHIVGDDQYNEVRITVNSNERVIDILNGYDHTVVKTERFSNNSEAYKTFLKALDNLGFGLQRKVLVSDDRGVCPLGNRYIYELNYGPQQTLRSWSDSCKVTEGTFAGVANTVITLFKNQITDYNKFVLDTRL